ncbi:MAG: chromosome segregation protein SMC [Armatimonadetes bacterium]|nr:chromosome segregation protein SMC [Armatimonadota bacterium]
MKLKRVRIQGFKTFADKTEFELGGDIVAVVGPNGCGKSNIVDAMLWGLGETSARALRAQSGKEVIFAGSVHRKAMGYAEVTLTFDNEDGALPMDCAEVSVTRRVDRSGQGEYEINKRACRLKDVADLLADSGLGRAGYAIVGQSDIDQALAASPQQRRAWIDEAAGVQRYRMRRQEAVRRLDAASTHLRRVQDVLQELDAQREPLAEEAEVAVRYKSALKGLRQVECGLLVKELAAAVEETEGLAANVLEAQTTAERETALAASLEARAKETAAQAATLESEAEGVRKLASQIRNLADEAASAISIAETRLQSLTVLEENLEAEAGSSRDRLSHASEDLEAAIVEVRAAEQSLEALSAELSGADTDAKALAADLESAEQALTEARERMAEAHRADLEREHRRQRAREAAKELQGIDGTLPDLQSGIEEAQASLTEAETAARSGREALEAHDKALAALVHDEEDRAAEVRKILAEVAALDGKRRGIEATIAAHEGLSQGARAVLDLVRSGKLEGEFRPVGECVQADPDLAVAMDTALGAAANDLIVPDEGHAKRAIQWLKDEKLGRATFQPVDLVRPQQRNRELERLAAGPGVVGIAADLVECRASHRPVIESLLGRVLVVEDLDVALRLARTSGWSRCVTLDGEVVHASGAVTGGRALRQTSGLVQRTSELAECEKSLKGLQKRLSALEAAGKAFENRRSEAVAERTRLQSGLQPVLLAVEEARSWLKSLESELASTERARARLLAEIEGLEATSGSEPVTVDVTEFERVRDEAWKAYSARLKEAESSGERLREARDRAQTAKRRVEDCERRVKTVEESERHRAKRAGGLGPEREAQFAIIERARSERDTHEAEHARLSAMMHELSERRRGSASSVEHTTEQAQEARKAASQAENAAYQAELRRTRIDAKRATVLERLLEEYGVDQAKALSEAPTTVVPPDAGVLVARLRKELKEMGDVNLGAVEAYERLTERFEELDAQAKDIESGMDEVKSSIRELDRLTRDKFTETFVKIKEAFGETFKTVFGGGEGVLDMIQGGEDLDAGVEISVTVPGKKKQRLELLSGGERALSALAFLFALLKVKPSPLVILDEVDAPLDGRNVERFIGLMRDFSKDIQFVLVTHNTTTIQCADVWFGVTMQEPGVSTLVPFKVAEDVGRSPAPDKALVAPRVPDAYFKG